MRRVLTVLVAVLAAVLVAAPAMAAPAGKDSPANDNPNNLYLYQKDSGWNIVWDGAWGKYNYRLNGTTISGPFNGHELVAGVKYALVEYLTWPNVVVLGTGTADEEGDVHIITRGVLLPGEFENKYKIWLVPTSDLTGNAFNSWHPQNYLFEHNLIP